MGPNVLGPTTTCCVALARSLLSLVAASLSRYWMEWERAVVTSDGFGSDILAQLGKQP
jgi:hypothetical protein